MRIGLVPKGGRDWIAGTVYLQNLVRALTLLPAQERPSLYFILGPGQRVDDHHDLGPSMPPLRHYTFTSGMSFPSRIASTIRHHGLSRWPTSLPRLARQLELSALFPLHTTLGPKFTCPWIGWIPDFQHKRMPRFFSEQEIGWRDQAFQQLLQDAPQVVVTSQDVYRDLIRWFAADAEKVKVLPFSTVAAPEWYEGDPDEEIRAFGLPRKYLMFPSQFWIHKNHRCLFEAIRIVKERSYPDVALVCTGQMHDYRHPRYGDELLADVKRHGLEHNVRCLGLLERHTQMQLLRGAAAVVQPSFFEGWSSLVEDARTMGKHIYLSDIPIHREQDPPDAQFFDPESPEALATLIAADWERLTPGPDRLKEQAAFALHVTRSVAYARLFLDVAREAATRC